MPANRNGMRSLGGVLFHRLAFARSRPPRQPSTTARQPVGESAIRKPPDSNYIISQNGEFGKWFSEIFSVSANVLLTLDGERYFPLMHRSIKIAPTLFPTATATTTARGAE